MNLEQLIDQFELVTDTDEGFEQLRSVILDLAVRGKLTTQNQKDVSASTLLKTIKRKREKLYEKGEIRKQSDLPEITKDEIPYELPQSWSWERLGNVGIVNPRIDADEDIEASFVPMKLISEDYSESHDFEVRMWGDIRRGYTHFGENDVGMAKITPCFENGKAAIFRNLKNGIGAGTTELYVFRAIPETILPEYVYSFVQSARFKAFGKSKMSGTAGQQRVPRSYFEEALFPLPPFEEQQRIVQKIEILFSQVDELEQKVQQDRQVDERLQVAVLDDLQSAETPEASRQSWQRLTDHFEQIYRKPEHIDQLKQAILNEAIRGRLVPQDPNDEPAEKLLRRIKEEKQRLYDEGEIRKPKINEPDYEYIKFELPKGWEAVPFGNIATIWNGRQYTKAELLDSGTPVIRIQNLTGSSDNWYYSDMDLKEDKYCEEGDLLYSWSGTFTPHIWQGPKAIFHYHIWKIDLYDKMDQKYIYYLLEAISESLRDSSHGIMLPHMTKGGMQEWTIPLPPYQEQKRIVRKLKELFTWCDDLKEKLSRSQQTDQRLLVALVNGALEDNEKSKESEEASIYQMPNERVKYPKLSKVSGMNLTDVQAGMMARVMNGYERYRGEKAHLGRTKMEKTCHIIESHVGIDLGRKPRRMKHGSADFQRLRSKVEPRAKKLGWFDFEEDENGVVYYKKGTRFHEPFQKLGRKLVDISDEIDRIIELFVPLSAHDAEVRQTVYAAWHDLVAYGQDPSYDQIVEWSSTEKYWAKEKEEIPKQEFYEAIKWLKENDLVPDGKGKLTLKEQ